MMGLQLAGYDHGTVWQRLRQVRRLLGDENFLFYLFTLGIDRRSHQQALLDVLKAHSSDTTTADGNADREATRGSVYVMVRGTLNPPPCEVRVIVTSQVDTRIYCQAPDATLFRQHCSVSNTIVMVHLTSEYTEKLTDHTPVRESADVFCEELAVQARSNRRAMAQGLVDVLGQFAVSCTAGTAVVPGMLSSKGVACVVMNLSDSYDLGEALSSAGVPYVICWMTKVNAYASVLFAKELYHFCRLYPQDYRKCYELALDRLRLSNVVFGNPEDVSALQAARQYERNPSVLVAGIPHLFDLQERRALQQQQWLIRTYHMSRSMVTNELTVPNCFLVLPYGTWKEMDTTAAAATAVTATTAASTTTKARSTSKIWGLLSRAKNIPKEIVVEELIIVFLCPVDGRPVPYDDGPGLRFTVPRDWVQKAYSTMQTIRGKFPLAFGVSSLLVKAALSKVVAIEMADVFPPEVLAVLQGVTELSTFMTSYVEETLRDIDAQVGKATMASLMSTHGRTVTGQAYRQVRPSCPMCALSCVGGLCTDGGGCVVCCVCRVAVCTVYCSSRRC